MGLHIPGKFLEIIEEGLGKPEVYEPTFKEFIPLAWKVTDGHTPLVWGWHIDAIAEHLDAVTSREIKRLIITIPPRTSKSRLVSIFWPAWSWIKKPSEKFLCSSYAFDLAIEHSVYCRRVIQSDWYQREWSKLFSLTSDANRRSYFENDASGYRMATSAVAAKGTGFGGSCLIVDDPISVKEAPSKARRLAVIEWWSQVMTSRLNNPKEGAKVIVCQRTHMNDLVGYILEKDREEDGFDWDVLNIPMEYNPRKTVVSSLGWEDPREVNDELMWPEMYGPLEVASIKRELGTYGWNSQFNQSPSPPVGGIVNRDWWKYYDDIPLNIHGDMDLDQIVHSWDFTFKSSDTSDYVVGQVWGAKGAQRLILDQVRGRMSFTQSIKAIRNLCDKWPANMVLVEDKANGPAIIQVLKKEIPALIPFDPGSADKVSRLESISPQIEAGDVLLPRRAGWVDDYIEEFASATPDGGGQYWDQIDATTQALIRMTNTTRKLTWGRSGKTSGDGNSQNTGKKKSKISWGRKFIVVGGGRRSSL